MGPGVFVSVERFAGSAAEWDGFVRRAEGWTHCHLLGWREVMEKVFGHECPYLATRGSGGELTGVLPLVRVRSRVFGHFLVSMPFLNYGGPLGTDEAIRTLVAETSRLVREGGVKLLELRSLRPLPLTLPVSHRKITVRLDLPDDPDDLWKALKAKVRSQVRRPRKEGVTIRFGPDQVEPFHQVFARHMRDLGTPTQPRGLFETIVEHFPDDAIFGCAYLDDRPVAAGAGFVWGREFEMTWASSLRECNRIAPNMLLYWSFMERVIQRGVRTFNFGRCTPGGGTHRFKQQWGSRDVSLYWYQDATGEVEGTPSPDSGALAWGPRLWRHLPLWVANRVGPRIVRNIP